MLFRRIRTPGTAHNAYLLAAAGAAAIIDPRRDIGDYLRLARAEGVTIRYVIETHRHEDFVLGSTELACVTGARVVNGDHHLFGRGDIRLRDGERLNFGGISLRALHTPGHTPESTSYAVYAASVPDAAWGVFTGDALLIGGSGRTDLGGSALIQDNAGALYDTLHDKVLPLGDQALVLPAHGAGSLSGDTAAKLDDSTLGLERRYNPVFTLSRQRFLEAKVARPLPRPAYFSQVEKLNLRGGAPLPRASMKFGERGGGRRKATWGAGCELEMLQPRQLAAAMRGGMVIDTRSPEAFAGGHIPGAYNVWLDGLGHFGGWLAAHETQVYLVVDAPDDIDAAARSLARVGVDWIAGALAGGFAAWRDAGMPIERSGTITPRELAENLARMAVLDVRDALDIEDGGRIPHAMQVDVAELEARMPEIAAAYPPDEPLAVASSVGLRGSLAASILLRHGYRQVYNLLGGMAAWRRLGLHGQGCGGTSRQAA